MNPRVWIRNQQGLLSAAAAARGKVWALRRLEQGAGGTSGGLRPRSLPNLPDRPTGAQARLENSNKLGPPGQPLPAQRWVSTGQEAFQHRLLVQALWSCVFWSTIPSILVLKCTQGTKLQLLKVQRPLYTTGTPAPLLRDGD